jgi:hypothetical protein
MPTRRRASTALLDPPDDLPGAPDEQDVTPPKPRGRPRKAATSSRATGGRPGRKPGTVSITSRGSDGKIMSEAAMKAKVAGVLGMLFALGVAGLELKDPEMAECVTEPIGVPGRGLIDPMESLVDHFVNLLSRNKKALAYAAKGDGITEIVTTSYLLFVIGKRMYQLSASRRSSDPYQGAGIDDDAFPAYTGAGN